ncbi:hypothetical protein ACFTZ8_26855 [Streptomyces fungicidicus]|uniref:hypothetical protein n=1 Tax=Streptomyces fungicidicus TaxID=68203 RepID=UPI00364386FC
MSQSDAELTLNKFGGCLTSAAFGKILDASHLDPGTKATIRSGKFALEVDQKRTPGAEFVTSVVVPTIGEFVASKVASWLSLGGCILFEAAPAAG